jgi:hypothetical protein
MTDRNEIAIDREFVSRYTYIINVIDKSSTGEGQTGSSMRHECLGTYLKIILGILIRKSPTTRTDTTRTDRLLNQTCILGTYLKNIFGVFT